MARARKVTKSSKRPAKAVNRTVTPEKDSTVLTKVQNDLQNNQSILNIILGSLVVIVLAVLLFNYFSNRGLFNQNQNQGELGASQQIAQESPAPSGSATTDVAKENLPGNYTVKDGDTLFLIAQKYYGDGYQYTKIAQANNLSDVNKLDKGQVLNIPKLENVAQASPTAQPTAAPSEVAQASPNPTSTDTNPQQLGTGGAINQTIWGERITGDTYTVQAGDWLSKIAGRAYGDIMQYTKIAQVNNISNPDVIAPGTVLKIPR